MFGIDKAQHMVVGVILFGAIMAFIDSMLVGVLLVLLVAIGKEVYDHVSKKGKPEILDVVATVILPLAIYGLSELKMSGFLPNGFWVL